MGNVLHRFSNTEVATVALACVFDPSAYICITYITHALMLEKNNNMIPVAANNT